MAKFLSVGHTCVDWATPLHSSVSSTVAHTSTGDDRFLPLLYSLRGLFANYHTIEKGMVRDDWV